VPTNAGNVVRVSASEPCRSPAPHRLGGTLVWLLGRASQRAHHLTQERLAAGGVRKWHYAVLATLAEFGPAAQAEIGRRLGVDRSDMVALLNDLEADGYVSRTPDPADRRRNSVVLTTAGRTVLAHFDRMVIEADNVLLHSLSPDEREQLAGLLERVIHTPAEPDTPPPSSDEREHPGLSR
jgi:MarR family transcriptional regulator, lower aerobic nicotinate degradation pathway regulator